MHILHASNYFRDTHRHVGGAEQACYRTAMLAQNHGYTISVATTRADKAGPAAFSTHEISIVEDYLPRMLKQYIEGVKWYSIQSDPLASRRFRRILRNSDAEIVHFHNVQFLTLSLLEAVRDLGKKSIVSIYDYWLFCPTVMLVDTQQRFCERAHGTWCVDCLPPLFRTVQKMLLGRRREVFDRYLDMVDGFHVLSEHSRTVLEGYGISPRKIHVVPLTLPLEYDGVEEADHEYDPQMIFFAGWLNERKGLHRLIEAMPMVIEECPAARLVACAAKVKFGEEYREMVQSKIDSGGIRDRVTVMDHLSPEEVEKLVRRAAVVVIPEQYENMSPLLMIEAMFLARPVVISRVGGVPEFIEDGVTGWLADPHNPDDFAKKIVSVLKHPDRAEKMGRAAREAILKKCNDNVIWEKTRSMYESVANR